MGGSIPLDAVTLVEVELSQKVGRHNFEGVLASLALRVGLSALTGNPSRLRNINMVHSITIISSRSSWISCLLFASTKAHLKQNRVFRVRCLNAVHC